MPFSAQNVTAPTAAVSRAVSWHMWVPCVGMALCSWLSFVDRQVLAILSPTILADTGLTNQDFTNAASFFFLVLHRRQPRLGICDRSHRSAQGNAAGGVDLDGREHLACVDDHVRRLRARSIRARPWRRSDISRRAANRRRVTAGRQARPRHRPVVQRWHNRRRDDAAPARSVGHSLRLADGLHGNRRARRHLAARLGRDRTAALPAGRRAQVDEDGVAESVGAPGLGPRSSATPSRQFPRDQSSRSCRCT